MFLLADDRDLLDILERCSGMAFVTSETTARYYGGCGEWDIGTVAGCCGSRVNTCGGGPSAPGSTRFTAYFVLPVSTCGVTIARRGLRITRSFSSTSHNDDVLLLLWGTPFGVCGHRITSLAENFRKIRAN